MDVIEGASWVEFIPQVGCERHLRQEIVGRVAMIVDGHPEIFPVNHALDDDGAIVFRTDRGTLLDALVQNATVAFEVDGIDEQQHLGWSVLVVGQAKWVETVDDLAALRRLSLEPWAVGEKANFVRITPSKITGRQIQVPRERDVRSPTVEADSHAPLRNQPHRLDENRTEP